MHEIRLKEGAVPYQSQYNPRLSPKEMSFVMSEVEKLLAGNLIASMESTEGWCAAISIAYKRSGKPRLCIAYIKLNEATINESFPIPNSQEELDKAAGHRFYCNIDGFCGYWVIGL